MNGYPVHEDCLQIGGIPLTRLAQRVGRTPFYAYERQALGQGFAQLRAAMPAGLHIHYALKANPMPALLAVMAGLADGMDVASSGELRLALDAGVAAAHISLAGPAKSDAELRCAVAAGALLNMESETEMERLAIVGEQLGMTPRVAVRVNPGFRLRHAGLKMGGGPQPFGVDAERVPAMLRRLGQLGLDFHGFHIFSGSQNLDAEAIRQTQAQSINLALELANDAPAPMRSLNIGGGFGVPYAAGDRPLALESISDGLRAGMERLPGCQLVIELGRYLVAQAGCYVCRIIERKVSRGQVFLITDGGLHQHLAATGNLGQMLRRAYPVAIGNKMQGEQRERVSITGPLCTPLDVLADDVELARASVGDLVVVFQSGAYGFSASPSAFLSHPPALEVLV